MKRFLRTPWFWILVAVAGVLVVLQFAAPNGGYDEVDTSEIAQHIEDGEVKEITFRDQDQEIKATLDDDSQVMSNYIDGQQESLLESTREQL